MRKSTVKSVLFPGYWLPVIMMLGLFSCSKTTEYIYIPADWVSQYTLDKIVVEVNTTNVATGFETIFQSIIPDSSGRARLCQAFVEPVRFFSDQSGYFFMYDFDCVNVAHGTQKNPNSLM